MPGTHTGGEGRLPHTGGEKEATAHRKREKRLARIKDGEKRLARIKDGERGLGYTHHGVPGYTLRKRPLLTSGINLSPTGNRLKVSNKPATESTCAQGASEYSNPQELSPNPPQGYSPPLLPLTVLSLTPAPGPCFSLIFQKSAEKAPLGVHPTVKRE